LFRPSPPSLLPSHGPIACGKYYSPAQVRQERERVPWACSVFPTLARPTKRAARGPCALPNAGCVRQRTTLSVGRLTTGHGQSPQLLPAAMNTSSGEPMRPRLQKHTTTQPSSRIEIHRGSPRVSTGQRDKQQKEKEKEKFRHD
jgi:hypothetical protein